MLNPEMKMSAHSARNPRVLSRHRPLSILIFDLNSLTVLSVNDTAVQQYGYSREEFLGITLRDVMQKEQTVEFLGHITSGTNARMRTSTWQHQRKDGATIEVETLCYRFLFQDRQAILVLIKEVTQPRQRTPGAPKAAWMAAPDAHESADIISRVDRRLMFAELNREIDKLTGMSGNALVESGSSFGDVMVARDTLDLQSSVTHPDVHNAGDMPSGEALNLPLRTWFPSWPDIIRYLARGCVTQAIDLRLRAHTAWSKNVVPRKLQTGREPYPSAASMDRRSPGASASGYGRGSETQPPTPAYFFVGTRSQDAAMESRPDQWPDPTSHR